MGGGWYDYSQNPDPMECCLLLLSIVVVYCFSADLGLEVLY